MQLYTGFAYGGPALILRLKRELATALREGRLGRAWLAIREDELAASAETLRKAGKSRAFVRLNDCVRASTGLYISDDGGENWKAQSASFNVVSRPFYFACIEKSRH